MASGLTIGELARATGIPARTIRYYEQVGVMPQPRRTAAGYRNYTQAAVNHGLFLRRSRALGLSLEQARKLSDAFRESGSFRPRLRELVSAHLSAVEQKIAELEILRRQLRRVLERLSAPHGERNGGRRGPGAERCSCLDFEAGAGE